MMRKDLSLAELNSLANLPPMSKIYYVGDWAIQMGPVYAETPFNYAYKGLDLINYGQWLKAAFEAGGHECTSVPTWDFYQLGPKEYREDSGNL